MASPSLISPRIEPVVPHPRRPAAMRDNRGAGFVWLSAALAACVLLLLLAVVWLSLTVGVPAIPGGPYSLANIAAVLGAEDTWSVLADTLVFALVATLLAMLGGTAVAWVVERRFSRQASDLCGDDGAFAAAGILSVDGLALSIGAAHRVWGVG